MAHEGTDCGEGEGEAFPWHLGLFDAHCHPTDLMTTMEKVPSMRSKGLTVMATRRQDQHLVASFVDELQRLQTWPDSKIIIPAFGWHPWFSHQIIDDQDCQVNECPNKMDHYKQVIIPAPEDTDFLDSLPEPLLLSEILHEVRSKLLRYPDALIGEVGLDKAFRIPAAQVLDQSSEVDPQLTPGSREGRRLSKYRVRPVHQQRILTEQLQLAGELKRPVSVHGVAAHGLLYETISRTWLSHQNVVRSKRARKNWAKCAEGGNVPKSGPDSSKESGPKSYPPRICLHSYSGHSDTMKQYLHPSVPAKIFFSFSSLVNFSSESPKAVEVIQAVPPDRLLAESDLHAAGEEMDELMEDVVKRICQIKGWTWAFGVQQLADNWRSFIYG